MNEQEFNKINAEKLGDIIGTNNTIAVNTVNLPSAEEYRAAAEKFALRFNSEWSEPKYKCPKCDGGMRRNLAITLASYPPQYKYQCDNCGHIDYQFM